MFDRPNRARSVLIAAAAVLAAGAAGAGTLPLGEIMPLGDSITVGQNSYGFIPGGWRDPFYTDMTTAGYGFQLVGTQTTNADGYLYGANQYYHEGHSGFTITAIGGRDGIDNNIGTWMPQVQQQFGGLPSYILLMIGTNDVDIGQLAGADTRLAALINHISNPVTGLDPGARLIVSTILPDTGSSQKTADSQTYNTGLLQDVESAELAGENVGYTNIGALINPATDMNDTLHPNAAGNTIIANAWAAAIESGPTVAETEWFGGAAGSWTAATSWSTGVPETDGVTANLGTGASGTGTAVTISLGSNVTVGHLVFNSSAAFTVAPLPGGVLTFNDTGAVATGAADITVLAGNHTIAVPIAMAHGLKVNTAAGTGLTVSGQISGATGLSVVGPGTLSLSAAETYTGPTTVTGGTLDLLAGGQLPPTSDLTVNSGGRVVLPPGSAGVVLDSLTFAGTTGNWAGSLDIGAGAIDLSYGLLWQVTDQARQGYALTAGAAWNGTAGIVSSAAADDPLHIHGVGVVLNNAGGNALFSSANPFDGVVPGLNDILIRCTYVGDANLDGVVDGSDYSLIDNGYINQLTGWYNGDFNYDGVIDGTDYALIDNAFNNQNATASPPAVLAASTAEVSPEVSAVPEPAVSAMFFAALSIFRRRRGGVKSICPRLDSNQ